MRKMKFDIINVLAIVFLSIFILTAIFSPFLANDKAIFCKNDEGFHIPLLRKDLQAECDYRIDPLIKYKYNNIDSRNANFASPHGPQKLNKGQQRHFLGTDQLGRDVAAGLIHSSRVAILTGALSMFIALVIGMFFGLLGAFYGNDGYSLKRSKIFNGVYITLGLLYFIGNLELFTSSYKNGGLLFLVILLLILFTRFILTKFSFFSKRITVPLDLIFSNFIEIFQSLPGSFLILILVSLFTKASLLNVILIIGLMRWPMIARYVRAEMLKIKEQRYIEASRAIGMTDWRIIFKHAMPATLTPVIVAIAFGFSSAILLESSLSFLGIGLPADHVSFGSILSEARKNYDAWWLAVFPGLAIFLLVFTFNYLGDQISKSIEKK